MGDLDANVDTYIESNKPAVTKGGKQLIKMTKEYVLGKINLEKGVCKGLWTTVQGQKRPILDYVLTNSKLLSTVTELIVDENRQYSVLKLGKSRKTYSDYNAILLKQKLLTVIEKQKKNRIMT